MVNARFFFLNFFLNSFFFTNMLIYFFFRFHRMRCLSFLRLKLFKLLVYQNRQNFKTVQQHFLKVSNTYFPVQNRQPRGIFRGSEKKFPRIKNISYYNNLTDRVLLWFNHLFHYILMLSKTLKYLKFNFPLGSSLNVFFFFFGGAKASGFTPSQCLLLCVS